MKYEKSFEEITGKKFQDVLQSIKDLETIQDKELLNVKLAELKPPYISRNILDRISEEVTLSQAYEKDVEHFFTPKPEDIPFRFRGIIKDDFRLQSK